MLILETGAGDTPNANSYQSVDDLDIYARIRGIDLTPLSEADKIALLIRAMDYLEAQASRYKGHKTHRDQPLQWPRADVWGVEWDGCLEPDNSIPRVLCYAQLNLALEYFQANNQAPDAPQVKREKVEGAVEIEYFENKGLRQSVPAHAPVAALLANLFKNNGLRLVRA